MNQQGNWNVANKNNDRSLQPQNSQEQNHFLPGIRLSKQNQLEQKDMLQKRLPQQQVAENNRNSQYKSPELKLRRISTGLAMAASQIPKELYTQYKEEPVGNIQELVFYQDFMYYTLSQNQFKNLPTNYCPKQNDFNNKHREATIDWLYAIKGSRLNLSDETLFLAVNYFDRYLSNVKVKKNDLQKVAVIALYIASKYEDVYPLRITEVKSYLPNMDLQAIKKFEMNIALSLNFKFVIASSLKFLNILVTKFKITNLEILSFCRFILHIPLFKYNMITLEPNRIAASALHFSLTFYQNTRYIQELEEYTQFNQASMKDILKIFVNEIQSIHKRNYQNDNFKKFFMYSFGNDEKVMQKIKSFEKEMKA